MTKITDAGLEHLQGLKNLQELNLDLTKVTPEGVAKLQKFLPNTKITSLAATATNNTASTPYNPQINKNFEKFRIMGQPTLHSPALLLLAAFSRHDDALQWAKHRAEEKWGPIELESPAFEFAETDYYTSTMGPGLKKIFFAFENTFDPADLVDVKLLTNVWEDEYANLKRHPEQRPLESRSRLHHPGQADIGLDQGFRTSDIS